VEYKGGGCRSIWEGLGKAPVWVDWANELVMRVAEIWTVGTRPEETNTGALRMSGLIA
jgi:hypothetical protein